MNCIKVNYWRMDLSRTFGSWRWVLSVFGVVFAFALCGGSGMQYSAGSVLDIVDSIFWGRLLMLTIPFCTFAFGDGLCADCEKSFTGCSISGETGKNICAQRSRSVFCPRAPR